MCTQRVLCGTFIWSLLEHDNVLPLLGVTTFDNGLSTVTELIIKGNAHDYVQDPEVEPGPLVRQCMAGDIVDTKLFSASRCRTWVTLLAWTSSGAYIPRRRDRRKCSCFGLVHTLTAD